jgi:hypothetical protein
MIEDDVSVSFSDGLDFRISSTEHHSVVEILTATQWDCNTMGDIGKKDMILQQRNQLLTLMHYDLSSTGTTSNNAKKQTKTKEKKDELDSYDALVREAGNRFRCCYFRFYLRFA